MLLYCKTQMAARAVALGGEVAEQPDCSKVLGLAEVRLVRGDQRGLLLQGDSVMIERVEQAVLERD